MIYPMVPLPVILGDP